jgi:hypothetical protein
MGRPCSRWSRTSAALVIAPMRVGLRLTSCRAAKVSLSRALARSATPCTPRMTLLYVICCSVSSAPLGFLYGWRIAGEQADIAQVGQVGIWCSASWNSSAGSRSCAFLAQVVSCSRPGRTSETRQGKPSGYDRYLDVAAMVLVFAAPPQVGAVRAAHRDPVGVDGGAVEVEVGHAGGLRGRQRVVHARGERGEHGDGLVEVVVGGGGADRVVGGQLAHAGVVQEPAQCEHRQLERARRPCARARADRASPPAEQPGEEGDRLAARLEHAGERDRVFCDDRSHTKPLDVKRIPRQDLLLPGVSCFSDVVSDRGRANGIRAVGHTARSRRREKDLIGRDRRRAPRPPVSP